MQWANLENENVIFVYFRVTSSRVSYFVPYVVCYKFGIVIPL